MRAESVLDFEVMLLSSPVACHGAIGASVKVRRALAVRWESPNVGRCSRRRERAPQRR
jgi:hypothetical protein